MLDFVVNVRRPGPPDRLVARLAARLPELGRYPGPGRPPGRSRWWWHGGNRPAGGPCAAGRRFGGLRAAARAAATAAALIVPSFTEPEAVLATAGVAVCHVVLLPPFRLDDGAVIPDSADLVVVGNPTNPTGVCIPARRRSAGRPGVWWWWTRHRRCRAGRAGIGG